jgi:hypothetical protein
MADFRGRERLVPRPHRVDKILMMAWAATYVDFARPYLLA